MAPQVELRRHTMWDQPDAKRPRVKTPAETTCPSGRLLETDSGHQKTRRGLGPGGHKAPSNSTVIFTACHRRSTRGLSHNPSARFRRTRSGNVVEFDGRHPRAGIRCPGRSSYSLLAPEFSLFSANNSLLRLRREYACKRLMQRMVSPRGAPEYRDIGIRAQMGPALRRRRLGRDSTSR
jgi:hypothetical protein